MFIVLNSRILLYVLVALLWVPIGSLAETGQSDPPEMIEPGTRLSVPTFDSLKGVTRELNEIARGDIDTQSPLTRNTDPDSVVRGSKLYNANCVQCHGEGGIGAPNWHKRDASGNYPPPPLNGTAHTWHHPKAQLMEMIRNGGAVMPPFSSQLDDTQIEDIIHWFQSLWPDELYQAWARQNETYNRNVD